MFGKSQVATENIILNGQKDSSYRLVRLHMMRPSHFYDIESADQLFSLLKAVANNFMETHGKRTQDLLFLVFGLTHLREWIAPDYDPKRAPATPEEKFYQQIFGLEEFNVLRALCNRSKHMSQSDSAMAAIFGANFDDWPDIDSVTDFDRGPPIAYFVDGRDVNDVIRVVIKFYDENWFQKRGRL
jgi:hypothetical protein